jgi:predicted nuclease of predicted toxin-antitoxin system
MVRVLLDEDIDVRLRLKFSAGFEVETVSYRGWKGKKNGELLRLAAEEFDALVTLDRNLPSQQDFTRYPLGVVILRPRSQALEHLADLIADVEQALARLAPGQFVEVGGPT